MTAILNIDLSNSTFDLIQVVNTLISDHNKLTEANGVLQANGTLILSKSGTALIVNNAATFGSVNSNTIQSTTAISTNTIIRGIDVLTHANNSYARANTANLRAIGAFDQANSAFDNSNSGFSQANTANTIAYLAFDQANNSWATANVANTVPGSNGDILFANNGQKFSSSKFNINLSSNLVTINANVQVGDITTTGNLTSTSDRTLKSNVQILTGAMTTLRQVQGVSYNLLNNPVRSFGFIAQDVEKIIPEIVFGKEGSKSLAYLNLIAFCVEAIKELDEEIQNLKKQITVLQNDRQ